MVEIKFCGLTRPEDAEHAVALGAAYVGVIFAGGPRVLTAARAVEVLAGTRGAQVRRIGVFGGQSLEEILETAEAAGLDGVQLAGGVTRDQLVGLRTGFRGEIWGVRHGAPGSPQDVSEVLSWYDDGCDAVVLDAAVDGQLGGTGVALDWEALRQEMPRLRSRGRVVLAGGLRPENVARALALAAPDVVDVSSGVESAAGIKDPERMRAFAAAVRNGEAQ